ncbi:hypothetical protein K501DRAFT_194003, partial [Backusella circina FSU 941]
CAICSHPDDSFMQFLFDCPIKLQVWQYVWHTFIDLSEPCISSAQVLLDFLNLGSDSSLHRPVVHSYTHVLATALSVLWQAHWSFIFQDISLIISRFHKLLTKSQQKGFIINSIPHAPIPHISL